MKKLTVPESGSQADTTASRNRFGQYNRTRAIPVQPRTPAQLQARSYLSDCSAAWRGLTEAQRLAWNALASTVMRRDSLGQQYSPTGHQLFVGLNATLLLSGAAIVSAPPATFAFGANPATGLTSAGGALTLVHGAVPADVGLEVYASPCVSAGRAFNGVYRRIMLIPPAAAGPSTVLTAEFTAKFGAPVVGSKVFVRVVQYDVAGGWTDIPAEFSVIVA